MGKRSAAAVPLERHRQDLRERYRYDYLRRWEGRDLSAQHRFVTSDDPDKVLLSFTPSAARQAYAEVVIESSDEGATWHWHHGDQRYPPSERGIFGQGETRVAINNGKEFYRSRDWGHTWRGPFRIPSADDFHVDGLGAPNCFSAIVMTTGIYIGRIVLVSDYFLGQEGPDGELLCSIYTDDAGDTWHASRLFGAEDPLPKAPEGFGEPAVVEMPSGWLWMVFRSVYGELWQCVSRDGGETWNHATPTGFASPIANCYALRDPQTAATVLCWNAVRPGMSMDFRARHSLYRPRTNLVFSVSRDNCRTWTCPVTVEPEGGQYPTIHFAGKSMYIMYQSSPGDEPAPWHKLGLTLVAYDREAVAELPAWTTETIQPWIERGLVASWRALFCQPPSKETIT